MINVLFPAPASAAGRLVLAALRRSVSTTQAQPLARAALLAPTVSPIVVVVDAPDDWGDTLVEWVDRRVAKLVVFGRLPQAFAARLGCSERKWPDHFADAARSASAPAGSGARSAACVRYGENAARLGARGWERSFERFDFTDEWNNLGYGAIRADKSIWAVSQPVEVPDAARIASIEIDGAQCLAYAGLWEQEESSVLWFNRVVGPCDSFEWRLIERFLSDHRAEQLPCQPVVSEIPWGYDAAITSRLDCDEEIGSARELWRAYQRLGVPFSLAIHTSNLRDDTHFPMLREFAAASDTALLSHTATHAPNWGGSYEAARKEGEESIALIEAVTGQRVRYAVSPFHQSPTYALEALCDVGYAGCIGGIIRNDPEFLIARGGFIEGLPQGFIGHSQQTMLHGDCLLASGDPLAVFKQAFDLAFETRTLFGYLDHPFSARYQYGWADEAMRIDAHEKLVTYMRSRASKPLFMNENVALDFLLRKASLQVIDDGREFSFVQHDVTANALPLAVEYRGECVPATDGSLSR